jgi:hypothetical protein
LVLFISKIISFILLPIFTSAFLTFGSLEKKWEYNWDLQLVTKAIERFISPIICVPKAISNQVQIFLIFFKKDQKRQNTVREILLGIAGFFLMAIIVILPLLSAADPAFKDFMAPVWKIAEELLESESIVKILFIGGLAIALEALLINHEKTLTLEKNIQSNKELNPIRGSIILGGIFILYLLFLYLQIERLFIGNLPVNFTDTEELVKSGFWQLFFLSIINTGIFIWFYGQKNRIITIAVRSFIIASIFLLLSAAWRMGLYVFWYGLSYEKFFALYTVLFALGLFSYLIKCSFSIQKHDIFRSTVFSFIWAYSIMTVIPTENFIFRTNMYLQDSVKESRILLIQLDMLSADVYSYAKKHKTKLFKEIDKDLNINGSERWDPWFESNKKTMNSRKWYETNLSLELQK